MPKLPRERRLAILGALAAITAASTSALGHHHLSDATLGGMVGLPIGVSIVLLVAAANQRRNGTSCPRNTNAS